MKPRKSSCPHCPPNTIPQCAGGCLPVSLAALLAEVSRQRIYELMRTEQLQSHQIGGSKLVCVASLVAFKEDRATRKKTLDKTKKVGKSLHRNGLQHEKKGQKIV